MESLGSEAGLLEPGDTDELTGVARRCVCVVGRTLISLVEDVPFAGQICTVLLDWREPCALCASSAAAAALLRRAIWAAAWAGACATCGMAAARRGSNACPLFEADARV